MKSFFLDKFEYNYAANQKIIALIQAYPNAYSEKVSILIGHTINAHSLWNYRIQCDVSPFGVWDVFKISELAELDTENYFHSQSHIDMYNLDSEVNYSNSEGKVFSSEIATILFHIINHSTYHRGQLITELKLQGAPPISLDYIFFKH
ncbi:MAG: putative damage-inducible protein DinB [Ulvibacter sp.]|jgi:uncharacterized damage-inducible protein DinB